MILRIVVALSLVLAAPACGTKSNLLKPDGNPTPKGQSDPSRPANPITR